MSFWPSSSSTNGGLVDILKKTGAIQTNEVVTAMKRTDRAKYIAQMETPDGEPVGALSAYANSPHPIGFNQTISAPHMHGCAMELCFAAVKDVERPRILDVGVGSGYLLACFGRLAQARKGHVFGIELLPGLAQFARKNLQSGDGDLLDSGVASLTCANGWDGLPNKAPFHFIHVGAAAEKVPRALMDQLADGGQLVVPVNEPRGGQMLVEITRNGNEFTQRKLMAVWYVPLVRGRKMSV